MRDARSRKPRARFTWNALAERARAASIAASSSASNVLIVSPVAGFTDAIAIVGNLCYPRPIRPELQFQSTLMQGVSMSHAKHIRFLFAIALLVVTVPFSAFAQSSNGSISGTVTDDTGALLPGVTITAVNTATGMSRTSGSNTAGHFDIP